MNRTASLFVSVVSLWAASAAAQYWPKPAATPGVDVKCTGCLDTRNGKLTPGYPTSIKTFTGRFLDSQATQDYQQPFKTARAERMLYVPAIHRIYMHIGSAVFAYNSDTFFTRLAGGEAMMPAVGIPTVSKYGPHPAPSELVLNYDEFFYAENEPDNGWTIVTSDGQRRLFAIDADDQGYVYTAYSYFGWGILKDELANDHRLMKSVHQNYFPYTDDVIPHQIAVVKTSDSHYWCLINDGGAVTNVYDVTDRTNPTHFPTLNKSFLFYAKNAAMDRIAVAGDGTVKIYTSDALVHGGAPIVSYPNLGIPTSDGTNFYAYAPTPDGGFSIAVITPSGGTYTRTDYPTAFKGVAGGAAMHYGDGYLVWSGTTNGSGGLRVFKMQGTVPVEVDFSNYFQNYYFGVPNDARYTSPNFAFFYDSGIIKNNNHTYIVAMGYSLGDVYEIPNADGVIVNNNGVVGTPNAKIPPGSAAGPFYGDSVGFTATTGAPAPMSLTWDFGDGATAPGTTGTAISHQFGGTTAGTTLTRTVRATNINDLSITSNVNVNIAKPTARFGISSKFLFVQPNASSPAPIVVGDSFFDASDGSVEGHADTWVLDGVTTNTTPSGTVPVGACGTHSLAFTATYGPSAAAVPFSITPFNYNVRPFAAAVDVGTTDSANVTFISTSRATTDTTALPNATLNYTWTLVDSANNVVYGPQGGSAGATAIPSFVVPKQAFSGRQNLKAHLVLTATTVGAACAGFTTSDAFSRPLNAPDPKINGGCTNGGPPCSFSAASISGVDTAADGWTYSWSVAGGVATPQSGTGATFSPTFTQVAVYTVTLTAANAFGSSQTQTQVNVTTAGSLCNPITPNLTIFIGYNQASSGCSQLPGTNCTANVPVNFSVQTYNYDLSCGPHTFSWTFGDGGSSTSQTPSHTYTSNGTFPVTLNVSTPSGPYSTTATVTVGGVIQPPPPPPPPPSGGCSPITPNISLFVQYSQANSGCTQLGGTCNANSPVNFSVGTYQYDLGCGNHQFQWTFGDGGSSTSQTPSHTYTNNNTYTVTLTVTPPGGSPVQSTARVVVGNGSTPGPPPPPPPSGSCQPVTPGVTFFVTYTGPTSGCSQLSGDCLSTETIPFQAQAYNYDFGCATHTFQWDFGDNSTPTSGSSTSHRYVNAGTYNLRLTITANGQSYPVTQVVRVTGGSPAKPVLGAFDFVSTPIPGVSNGYVFTISALGNTSSANVTYTWDYGDGHSDTTTLAQTTHIYADSKSYTVTLTVSGYSGSIQHPAQLSGRHRTVHH